MMLFGLMLVPNITTQFQRATRPSLEICDSVFETAITQETVQKALEIEREIGLQWASVVYSDCRHKLAYGDVRLQYSRFFQVDLAQTVWTLDEYHNVAFTYINVSKEPMANDPLVLVHESLHAAFGFNHSCRWEWEDKRLPVCSEHNEGNLMFPTIEGVENRLTKTQKKYITEIEQEWEK